MLGTASLLLGYCTFPKESLQSCHKSPQSSGFPLCHIHISWVVGNAPLGLQIQIGRWKGVQGQRVTQLTHCTLTQKLLEFFHNVCINFFLHKRFHSESFEKCWPTITDKTHMENAAIRRVKNVSCLTLHSNSTNQDGKHTELELQGNFRHKT